MYISKDCRIKWEGVVPDKEEKYLLCEKCGSKKISVVAHWDGKDAYGYNYNCENGHPIRSAFMRNGGKWEAKG